MRVCCAHFHGLLWSILQLLGFVFILLAKGGGPRLGGSAASAVCFAALSGKVWQSSASSRGHRACCCACASRVQHAPRTNTVLAMGRRGPRGRGAVVTSCVLLVYLCSSAVVLSRVAFAARTVAGVANTFADMWGRPCRLIWAAETCAIASRTGVRLRLRHVAGRVLLIILSCSCCACDCIARNSCG